MKDAVPGIRRTPGTRLPHPTSSQLQELGFGAATDDDDHDGLVNVEEYAFVLDPKSGASSTPFTVPLRKGLGTFTYTRRRADLNGLAYLIWTSPI